MPSNKEFLSVLFGDDAQWAHVTDFAYDPGAIPDDKHLIAWKGDYFCRYRFSEKTNQYFTISTFYADQKNVARRRKALFRATHVIVLDDVKEKLSMDQVSKLPAPTWVLETSAGSEQWGYKLIDPCADRMRVDNLLDGLVANGLAPDGKDPGMKGVTRYVRLPDGVNTKASRLINGEPFKCRITQWNPFNAVTLEDLATPFSVNLAAVRREGRVDGAASVNDHPLLSVPDIITVKDERSDGRFDITCPWVEEHTNQEDNGTAIFTNGDGSIGFKCHHGSCQSRNGSDLLMFLEKEVPGFGNSLKTWQLHRSFAMAMPQPTVTAPAPPSPQPDHTLFPPSPAAMLPVADDPLAEYLQKLRSVQPFSAEANTLAGVMLKAVDSLPVLQKQHWHEAIRDVMRWSKAELKNILKGLREEWYTASSATALNFFDDVVFVREINHFYDRTKRIFYSAEAYQNAYADLDPDARKNALQGGMVTKVDKLDYAPLKPAVFTEGGIVYGNSWSDKSEVHGVLGDVSRWYEHFDVMGWGEHRDHMLKFMAHTIRHPDIKINHMLLLGGLEGSGKDFLLAPLVAAMGDNHMTIAGEELLSDFADYALATKHLNVNEAELGDRKEAMQVTAKIKPLAAAPPEYLRVNQKGIKPLKIRNLLSVTMTTNSRLPLRMNSTSRRVYAVWSDLTVRDEFDNMTPEWITYWKDRWNWMKNGGAEAVIYFLRNAVDLSKFDPGQAPPMTEFLRDIRDASKSPMQQTVEAFILRRRGAFFSDLATASDMVTTLMAGVITDEDIMYCDRKLFTPTRLGMVMREISGATQVKARRNNVKTTLWVIRNHARYRDMHPAQLYDEWEIQLQAAKKASPLTIAR